MLAQAEAGCCPAKPCEITTIRQGVGFRFWVSCPDTLLSPVESMLVSMFAKATQRWLKTACGVTKLEGAAP
jgi:hypothetical protein